MRSTAAWCVPAPAPRRSHRRSPDRLLSTTPSPPRTRACSELPSFDRRDLLDPRHVPALGEWRGQPDADDLLRVHGRDDPGTHAEDVRIVVLTREPRERDVVAERGSDAVDLVRRDLLALAGTPQHDRAIGVAGRHDASGGRAADRVVDRLLGT